MTTTSVRRVAPFALLGGLALAYFGTMVLHPSRTLYADHSDLIALHVPWETFLARSWRVDGEAPLWNPLQFAGLPFAHDVQAAISYPPHAIFRMVGERGVGAALSWLVVAHVVLGGWGMYAYARSTGLGPTAGFVAGVGFMLAGKWLLHLVLAGHYAFVGLAWLPWTLLGLHRAISGRSLAAATGAGLAFGMLATASHPQLTLYSGLFIAIWTLVFATEAGRSRVGVWLAFGAWTALVGAGIAAIQLLPSLEASASSSRGTLGLPEVPSVSLRSLLRAIGPSPTGVRPVVSWEPRSGLGVVWIAVALAAPGLTRGLARRRAIGALAIAAALSAFALGGAALFQGLPLFRMFRQPGRMFLLVGLPIAYAAALATQALLDRPGPTPEIRARGRRVVRRVAIVLIGWLAVGIVGAGWRNVQPHPYWFSLLVTVPAACWLVGAEPGRGWRVAWVVVLGVDLAAQTWPHVEARDLDELLAPSASARYVADHAGPFDRVLDRRGPGHTSSTPIGPAVAARLGLQLVGGYNAMDLVSFKAFLATVAAPDVVRFPYNGIDNIPIRHRAPLDLLGVRFLVQPAGDAIPPGWLRVATDPTPSAFTFAAGGVRPLPPYEVIENPNAYPRAFVASADGPISTPPLAATITSYRPNRIAIWADGPGLLVLADPWFPGWHATVDGLATPILRADGLFRGVPLAPGPHAVSFTFRPRSYAIGRAIRLGTLGVIALVFGRTFFRRRKASLRGNVLVAGMRATSRGRAGVRSMRVRG